MTAIIPTPHISPLTVGADGRPRASSLDVAARFGKQHGHVLRDIDVICEQLDGDRSNFGEISYMDGMNRSQRACTMDRDGFTLLAMGFTGAEALKWKLAYIQAFNAMEAELLARGNALTERQALRRALDGWDAADALLEAERLAHSATIVETRQIIATKEGVQECIFANALAKQINQALGKAMVDLKRFPRWVEQDGGEFFNRGFNEKQADAAHQLWFHVTKPQKASAQRPGEKLYEGWVIQITPIGQTKITNMVLRDKNRILPIYRSAYQNTPLRVVGGVQ